MPSNWFFDYEKIVRFSRARSADMNEIFASILEGFAKTNDYMVVTGNLTMTATDQRRLLIVPSGAITITLPSAGTLTAATERDIELLFGGLPTNNVILPASPVASINFNSVTVEGKSVATGQIKLASAGAYLRLRYSPSASTYVIVDQGTAPRVFGTPSSGTNIAPWVWYGDHVVIDSVTDAAITAIAMPTSKLLGRSFIVTVALAMLSGVVVGGGSDTINGAVGGYTVSPGQSVEFVRQDAGWRAIKSGETQIINCGLSTTGPSEILSSSGATGLAFIAVDYNNTGVNQGSIPFTVIDHQIDNVATAHKAIVVSVELELSSTLGAVEYIEITIVSNTAGVSNETYLWYPNADGNFTERYLSFSRTMKGFTGIIGGLGLDITVVGGTSATFGKSSFSIVSRISQ